ncbi:MAG: AAA family ATPase [Acidobacteriota bacterium]
MLKRIYVNNFKCLVNFEWEPGPSHINLMLGPNGSGKTTVFDCLDRVRAFVTGERKADSLFPSSTLTLWQHVAKQSFEIEWEREGRLYRYELAIEHSEKRTYNWVAQERLSLEGKPLLEFKKGEVTLYGENFSQPMFTYPVDDSFSAVSLVPPSGLYDLLTWFKIALHHVMVLQIIPPIMDDSSNKETAQPLRYFQNFVSWYRWVSQDQGMGFRLQRDLKEVLPGFSHFVFEPYGPDAKLLKVVFDQTTGPPITLGFSSLSDGQRMLIGLYALLHGLDAQPEGPEGSGDLPTRTLCLDEPDNFVASGEIQPWLATAEEKLANAKARLLMISHHPESINYGLMPSSEETYSVYWFSREENSHTRVQPVVAEEPGGLKPSELAARGWLNQTPESEVEEPPAKKQPQRRLTQLVKKTP